MTNGLSLALVVAHPDDDAYGFAGMVALHSDDPGFRFVLVHATEGEAGDIREGFPATRETLGSVRRAEDEAGWRALGREPDRHEWLGYPDGALDRVSQEELVEVVGRILDEEQPTVVATFGPDGVFGHPDHIAIGTATDSAFARRRRTDGHAFRRLLHAAIPESVFVRWNQQRAEKGLWVFDPTAPYHMRPVPDDEIGLVVDCRSVSHRTVAGLMEHRSQHHVMTDFADDPERWQKVVGWDWAVVAWPPPEPGTTALTDLFEGLP